MEKAKITPKDFFLWAGAFVAFYWSIGAFIFLIFDYINFALPNPTSYYPTDPYQSGIPYEMASLIVVFPLYLAIMWVIRRDIARDPTRSDLWTRRWALIFTLFIAGVTIAVDLIVLLTTFLQGEEITLAFILKVLLVLGVAAITFMHFMADFWGYWQLYPKRQKSVAFGVATLVVLTIVSGFMLIGSPRSARLYRFDEQKVSDLTNIQYQITEYYQLKQKLPTSLADLSDSISGYRAPVDSQTLKQYEYQATGPLSFEVCANFNRETQVSSMGNNSRAPAMPPYGAQGNDNWQHNRGRSCFTRTIDPQRYPPTYPKVPTAVEVTGNDPIPTPPTR